MTKPRHPFGKRHLSVRPHRGGVERAAGRKIDLCFCQPLAGGWHRRDGNVALNRADAELDARLDRAPPRACRLMGAPADHNGSKNDNGHRRGLYCAVHGRAARRDGRSQPIPPSPPRPACRPPSSPPADPLGHVWHTNPSNTGGSRCINLVYPEPSEAPGARSGGAPGGFARVSLRPPSAGLHSAA
jgi:hypothetical protein